MQTVTGLLDTGAAVNVLPYSVGVALGFVFEQETVRVSLSGHLSAVPTRVILVTATVASFAPVRLAFAWAQTDKCAFAALFTTPFLGGPVYAGFNGGTGGGNLSGAESIDNFSIVVTSVAPEPGTLALLGLVGVPMIAGVVRRRKA